MFYAPQRALFPVLFTTVLLTAADEPGSHDHPLAFAAGTWATSGTQAWPDGTWVEHRGIVTAELSADGLTLEKTFWAAFDNGHSLGGRSEHVLDPRTGAVIGRWVPTLGTWDATGAIGRMEGEDYVEVARGVDAQGRFTSTTRFSGIEDDAYRASSDLVYDSGEVSVGNWQIDYERVADVAPRPREVGAGPPSLDDLVGVWLVEGTAALPDGSTATHTSRVDARWEDGVLVREFWGALSSGAALRGRSTHTPAGTDGEWEVRWTPAGSLAPAGFALGRFEGEDWVEVQEQVQESGVATVVTRYVDLSADGYRVVTDLHGPTGEVTEALWTARFRRIR